MSVQKLNREMRQMPCAEVIGTGFLASRWARKLFNLVVRLEGGQMTSRTLRRVLADNQDVVVGPYSYGSLLEPGMCDQHAVIGSYCSIGKNVRRYGAAHPLVAPSMHPYFYNPELGIAPPGSGIDRTSIVIQSDVWIGSNVTILPGCSYIGFGAVIGAGAVVTKDVDDFAVVVGNPAKIIRYRHSELSRKRILESRYWELSPRDAQRLLTEFSRRFGD